MERKQVLKILSETRWRVEGKDGAAGKRPLYLAFQRLNPIGSLGMLRQSLGGKTTNWRAGCGRSASPIRREGGPKPIGPPYPHSYFNMFWTLAFAGVTTQKTFYETINICLRLPIFRRNSTRRKNTVYIPKNTIFTPYSARAF
jgi:hypothetical protein